MSPKMSASFPGLPADTGLDLLGHEILAEKAAALGRAGHKAQASVEKLLACAADAPGRATLAKAAADAVYAYFIQRELCGMRRHDEIVRDWRIPREVLVRLGAR